MHVTGTLLEKGAEIMKKVLIAVALAAVCVAPLWAASRGVVAELFASTS